MSSNRKLAERQLTYGYFQLSGSVARVYCPSCKAAVTIDHRPGITPTKELQAALVAHLTDACLVGDER